MKFLTRRRVPPLPKQRYMCIRCDEVKDDVSPGGRCKPCQAVVTKIALTQPEAYLHYLELVRKHKKDH